MKPGGIIIVNFKNKYKSLEKVLYYDELGAIVKEVYTEDIKFRKPDKVERVEMDFVRGLKSDINNVSLHNIYYRLLRFEKTID